MRIPQSGEKRVDFLHSECEVGVGMQTEDFRRVDLGEGPDVILESSQLFRAVVSVTSSEGVVVEVQSRHQKGKCAGVMGLANTIYASNQTRAAPDCIVSKTRQGSKTCQPATRVAAAPNPRCLLPEAFPTHRASRYRYHSLCWNTLLIRIMPGTTQEIAAVFRTLELCT